MGAIKSVKRARCFSEQSPVDSSKTQLLQKIVVSLKYEWLSAQLKYDKTTTFERAPNTQEFVNHMDQI